MTRMSLVLAFAASALLGACDKGPTKESSAAAAKPAETTATTTGATTTPAAPKGETFGAGVTLTDSVSIDAILANPGEYNGKTVRVEGTITDVCPKRGCWMELAGAEPGHKLKFKVTDGEMVFPMDSKGRHAVAQGTVSVRELSLDETKQYAEYQAKEYGKPYDPESITKPMQVVKLDGTGAIIGDKS